MHVIKRISFVNQTSPLTVPLEEATLGKEYLVGIATKVKQNGQPEGPGVLVASLVHQDISGEGQTRHVRTVTQFSDDLRAIQKPAGTMAEVHFDPQPSNPEEPLQYSAEVYVIEVE